MVTPSWPAVSTVFETFWTALKDGTYLEVFGPSLKRLAIGYFIGAALMIAGGVVEILLGVRAEGQPLDAASRYSPIPRYQAAFRNTPSFAELEELAGLLHEFDDAGEA